MTNRTLVLLGILAAVVAWSLDVSRRPASRRTLPGSLAPSANLVVLRDRLFAVAQDRGKEFPDVASFYRSRGYEPLWTRTASLSRSGVALMRRLSIAGDWGRARSLPACDERFAFVLPVGATVEERMQRIAELEWRLSEGFRRYANRLSHGRLDPRKVQKDWFLEDAPVDVETLLENAAQRGPDAVLHDLKRSHEERTGLETALDIYRGIARAGGWGTVPATKEPLEPGVVSEAVVALRKRLAASGDLPEWVSARPDVFDEHVEEAVRTFQRRHGLDPDGRVGSKTLAALDVPVTERLREIRVNLERRRWLPGSLPSEYVWINVPEYRLYAVREGKVVLDMPVIVGKPSTPTPLFSDRLQYMVFNPYWNVPQSIAVDELLPKQEAEPSYLASHHYQVLGSDSEPVPFARLSPEGLESGAVRIRKLPGAFNDLGRMKFVMPNRYSVYLHDTPSRYLFSRPARAFSHGCIRLADPAAFAAFLLEGQMTSAEIQKELHSPPDSERRLDRSVPVYIVYFTSFLKNGRVNFRNDVYGEDEAVSLALDDFEERCDSREQDSFASCFDELLPRDEED